MADIFIYNLTTIGGIDSSNDWMIIEDTSAGETKKVAPGSLPISTATQNALNLKLTANSPITAATKAKITYDVNGLILSGSDLLASDIPSGIDAVKIGAGSVDNTEFGYLNGVTSAIQTQLNAKQGSLTLTTTGSSGAATLIGNTLNIPQYSGGGASGVSSLEGLTGALQLVAGSNVTITDNGTDTITISASGGGGGGSGTVTSVGLTTGTTGTDVSVSGSPITTSGTITLNIPTASSINTGKLSSTDWSTFNNKQAALVSGSNIKTINLSSILGSGNINVAPASGINATAIASGSVDNTEFEYLNGVTSAIQTQIDSKTNKLITANRQAASYTLVLSDADKLVEMNVASANDLTVPASTFSTGTQILLSQYGAGQTTIVAGAGMTIRSNGGKLKLSGQYSGATLVFISGTEAYLFGDITA